LLGFTPIARLHYRGRLGHADAEDMVAATFLAAFRARSRFDTTWLDARPWLFGILTKDHIHHVGESEVVAVALEVHDGRGHTLT